MFGESRAPFSSSGLGKRYQSYLCFFLFFLIRVVQHICNHNDGSSLPSRDQSPANMVSSSCEERVGENIICMYIVSVMEWRVEAM